jgi:pilus assembly protein CpaB
VKLRVRSTLKKSTVQLIVIILLSVLSGLAIYTYISGVESRVRSTQQTTPVFIVLQQIPIGTALGTAINQGYIEEKQFPRDSVPTESVSVINALNSNLVTLQTLQPGQVVLQRNLGERAANTGALVIPDGQLAVTISLSDPAHVASFLQPGSEVTIFATGQSGKVKFTQVLISRTQVLAVGNQVISQSDGTASQNASALITVAVTPVQANELIHASQTLSLYFGLRSAGVEIDGLSRITDDSLFGQVK